MDKEKPDPDWDLVLALGGPAKVAELLGWTKEGGVQRVQNWKARGIPAKVKVQRPDLFLPGLRPQRRKASEARAAST